MFVVAITIPLQLVSPARFLRWNKNIPDVQLHLLNQPLSYDVGIECETNSFKFLSRRVSDTGMLDCCFHNFLQEKFWVRSNR